MRCSKMFQAAFLPLMGDVLNKNSVNALQVRIARALAPKRYLSCFIDQSAHFDRQRRSRSHRDL